MKIDNSIGDPDCSPDGLGVRFEAREVSDIRFPPPGDAFTRVRNLSERNEALYRSLVSPWVRAFVTPWSAAALEALHPMRTSCFLLSEGFLPWMRGVRLLAEQISTNRHPVAPDNPFKARETAFVSQTADIIQVARRLRDDFYEREFEQVYGAKPVFLAFHGPLPGTPPGSGRTDAGMPS